MAKGKRFFREIGKKTGKSIPEERASIHTSSPGNKTAEGVVEGKRIKVEDSNLWGAEPKKIRVALLTQGSANLKLMWEISR